jgi:hypothetical protein
VLLGELTRTRINDKTGMFMLYRHLIRFLRLIYAKYLTKNPSGSFDNDTQRVILCKILGVDKPQVDRLIVAQVNRLIVATGSGYVVVVLVVVLVVLSLEE